MDSLYYLWSGGWPWQAKEAFMWIDEWELEYKSVMFLAGGGRKTHVCTIYWWATLLKIVKIFLFWEKKKNAGFWKISRTWWCETRLPEFIEFGWGFLRRLLCPSRRLRQLRFTSSNSTSKWNLQQQFIQDKVTEYSSPRNT